MKSYSITILPDSIRGKHISVTLRGPLLLWGLLIGFFMLLVAGAGAYFYIIAPYESVKNRSDFARQLRAENQEFNQRIETARNHLGVLDQKLERQLKVTDKLYFVFGITDLGGGGYPIHSDDKYAVMLDTLEIVEKRYEKLENYLNLFDELPIRMPLRDPLRLSSEFGPRRSPFNAEVEMHRGVDLVAGPGTPIYAAGGGVVKIAGRWQDYNYSEYGKLGKFVLIEHGDTGYQTLYGHCSALLVRDGDVVEPGQVIARVGNTGWSTGPHLHFAIVYKNQFVDPKLYLLHFDSSKFLEEVLQDQDQTEREE